MVNGRSKLEREDWVTEQVERQVRARIGLSATVVTHGRFAEWSCDALAEVMGRPLDVFFDEEESAAERASEMLRIVKAALVLGLTYQTNGTWVP